MTPNESSKDTRVVVQKKWGQEEWIVNNEKYCGKLLYVKKGWMGSLHYHPIKDETFMCLGGMCWVEYIPDSTKENPQGTTMVNSLLRGWARDAIEIPHGTPHRFKADVEDVMLIEFSTPHSDKDVVRLEKSRKV
jgi:mannose-6-phosphate isomerase-like protein (cupin superfamily)